METAVEAAMHMAAAKLDAAMQVAVAQIKNGAKHARELAGPVRGEVGPDTFGAPLRVIERLLLNIPCDILKDEASALICGVQVSTLRQWPGSTWALAIVSFPGEYTLSGRAYSKAALCADAAALDELLCNHPCLVDEVVQRAQAKRLAGVLPGMPPRTPLKHDAHFARSGTVTITDSVSLRKLLEWSPDLCRATFTAGNHVALVGMALSFMPTSTEDSFLASCHVAITLKSETSSPRRWKRAGFELRGDTVTKSVEILADGGAWMLWREAQKIAQSGAA